MSFVEVTSAGELPVRKRPRCIFNSVLGQKQSRFKQH